MFVYGINKEACCHPMNLKYLTKLFFKRHISDRPMYWSLKVNSTESSATSAGSTILIFTCVYVLRPNAVAILCSTLIESVRYHFCKIC